MLHSRLVRFFLISAVISTAAFADSSQSIKFYGFLLPFYSLATSGVESFSNPNEGAISAAANPAVANTPGNARSSFQVAQSRFGLTVNPSATLEGRLEMDFIDFTKSSPTTSANPRLRRAVLTYSPASDLKFVFGQDWDLISPLMPFTYNYVGHFFEAGDIGFMRHQLQGIWTAGRWETGVALGLPQQTSTFAEGNTELTVIPTIALRETYNGDGWSFGGSALITSLRVSSTQRILSGALTAFGTAKAEGFEFRSEGYFGQNTQNLGMLGLSYCNASIASSCPSEAGFYVSAKKILGAASAFVSVGGAALLNNVDTMLSSYDPTRFTLAGTGPGIESNWTAHLGGDYKITEGAVLWSEVSFWSTRHHLAAGATADPQATALVFQVGSQVNL